MRTLPPVLAILLLAPLALAGHSGSPRTDEYLGTSILAWPAVVWADPGAPLADKNPRLILPGTSEVRARATVLDGSGNGYDNVALSGVLDQPGASTPLQFTRLSPGVFDTSAMRYAGGTATLRVLYDFGKDGVVDHVAQKEYRSVP